MLMVELSSKTEPPTFKTTFTYFNLYVSLSDEAHRTISFVIFTKNVFKYSLNILMYVLCVYLFWLDNVFIVHI